MALAAVVAFLLTMASPARSAPIRVRDARGKLFVASTPPKRIVSVAPANTEILFALGLGPRVVGVTDYCDYPPQARKLPKVGGVQLNYERILSLRPDMILATVNLQAGAIARMDALHLRVFAIDPHTVAETIGAIQLVGRATGTEQAAHAVARRMRATLAGIRRPPPGKRLRVLHIIQLQPLIVAGPGTFMDDCIRLAGGVNVAADAKAPYPTFSVEEAVLRKPQVILTAKRNLAALRSSPVWRTVPAVANGHIYSPDPDLLERPGPRVVDGVALLAGILRRAAAAPKAHVAGARGALLAPRKPA
jgi:iron complex transport system substrate-binding protein